MRSTTNAKLRSTETNLSTAESSSVASFLGGPDVMAFSRTDVMAVRERNRRRKLARLAVYIAIPSSFLWYRIAIGHPFNIFRAPSIPGDPAIMIPTLLLTVAIIAAVIVPLFGQRKSPHELFRPEQIDVGMDDVKGLGAVRDEVIRSLNVFLGYATFREKLGGNPRRGILFEGPPGTGKTHMAKAMAKHAGVPFLYVAGPAFQSMWYGQTAARIRSYFKALKKIARREGGAIGFIEEIDAFATTRGGMENATPASTMGLEGHAGGGLRGLFGRRTDATIAQGTGGTVNELLIQMQSFESLPLGWRIVDKFKGWINAFLPPESQLQKHKPPYNNVLIIAASNRGDALDPALLRPGRFDRRLYFDAPSRAGRRELVDYFFNKKSHVADLDSDFRRDELSAITFGYTPVMIEHLLDEALIVALRKGHDAMDWDDVMEAKMTQEVGLPHPVAYTIEERRAIATHEAGHAVAAYLIGFGRTLEILSIIKRRDALGLLGHSESEERFTKTKSELEALLKISLGGMVSEELFMGESGTGPAGDLAGATSIAAEMVGSLGMAGSLISFRASGGSVFDPGLVGRVLGNGVARDDVDGLLNKQKALVTTLLKKNKHLVAALRDALLERDELIGEQITQVLERAGGAVAQDEARHPKAAPKRAGTGTGRTRKAASTGL